MALLTAGTLSTTTCKALVWQPSGMSPTDFGNLNELIKDPSTVVNPTIIKKMWVQDGLLFVPGQRDTGFVIKPGDYIMVDANGWPFIVPSQNFSNSWTHS